MMSNKLMVEMIADPVTFCKVTEILYPHDYQEEILRSCLTHRRTIVNTSRQVGKTRSCAALAVWWAICKPLMPKKLGGGRPHYIAVIGPTKDLAENIYAPIANTVTLNPFVMQFVEKVTATRIIFKNRSQIRMFTAGEDGRQMRGRSIDLAIFDETSHVAPQSEELIFNAALFPALSATRGTVYFISTPRGRTNLYARIAYDAQHENEMKWNYIEIPYKRAITAIRQDTGLSQLEEEEVERQKIQLGNILFSQEYECQFIDVGLSFFDWNIIKSCWVPIKDNINDPILKQPTSEIFFGIDVARSRDKTVIVIVERYTEPYDENLREYQKRRMTDEDISKNQNLYKLFVRYVHVIEEPMKFFSGDGDSQENVIRNLFALWRPKMMFMDSTGLGSGIFEYMVKQGYPAEGIVFTPTTKKVLLDSLKNLMRTGRLAISATHHEMHNQLNGQVIEVTQAGTEVIRSTTKHDDIVMAMALAAESARFGAVSIPIGFSNTSLATPVVKTRGQFKDLIENINKDKERRLSL